MMETEYFDRGEMEWRLKKERVLSNFGKEFGELYAEGNPHAHAILEALMKDGNPYDFISHLISINKTCAERFKFLVERSTMETMAELTEAINNGKI